MDISLDITSGSLLNIDGLYIAPLHHCIENYNFVKTIYQILQKIKAQKLDELWITYPDYVGNQDFCNEPCNMDSWIDIAIKKQVQTLVFYHYSSMFDPVLEPCLCRNTSTSLVTLCLRFVSLSCQLIDCFLSNSPNLEELSITRGKGSLEHVQISGPSLKLKHLELIDNDIHVLEVSAPNLLSFNHACKRMKGTKFRFETVPLLSQLAYTEFRYNNQYGYLVLLPQLVSLTLEITSPLRIDADQIPDFPALKNLKQMQILLGDMYGGLRLFFRLFKASPSLCRLSLDLGTYLCPELKQELTDYCTRHECLKVIEIDAFSGCDNEVRLVMCSSQCSSALENIIIHPSLCKFKNLATGNPIPTDNEHVKSVVEKLQAKLPGRKIVLRRWKRREPRILFFFERAFDVQKGGKNST